MVEYKLSAHCRCRRWRRPLSAILHLPELRQLAIFDVNSAKVVSIPPVPEGDFKFVAGLDQLVVALPGFERSNAGT